MLIPSRLLLHEVRLACGEGLRFVSKPNGCSTFSTSSSIFSGHSRWATIKHDKARVDAKKNNQRTRLAQQIETISKLYGPDPESNPRLKTAVADAKRQGLPKAVLDSAINRGQGMSSTGKSLESVTIEAVFPGGAAAIIECQTESKGKTLLEVRTVLTRHLGSQSPVRFLFKRRGVITLQNPLPDVVTIDDIIECAMEADGFEDINDDNVDGLKVITEANTVNAVADAITNQMGVDIMSLDILWQPKDLVDVSPGDAASIESAVEKIKDIVEVRQVYLNIRR